MGVVVYLEPDTHISEHTMKLVYTLTGLATVLATGTQAFQLSTKNVQQLQNALQDRVEQKYTNMKRQFRQKRGLFDSALDQLSSEINIDDYNDAAADCKIRTAGFWNDCRQCIAQQCSSYMANDCGSSSPVPAELIAYKLPEFLQTSIDQAQDEYNRAIADLKLSRRSKRSAESTLDCQQFVSASNNIEVKCVNYNENEPQALSASEEEVNYPHTTDDAIFGNWKFTVQASHAHEMVEEGLDSQTGAVQIKLSIVDAGEDYDIYGDDSYIAGFQGNPTNLVKMEDDYYQPHTTFERSYPAQSGENAECNGAGCLHLGGNQFEVETEFHDDFNGFKFDCDGNENANCNQMIMDMNMESIEADENNAVAEKPCDGEGEPVEPITEVEDFLNSDSELTFCDQIGGCPDVPFVRRSSRNSHQRFNRAAKAQLCQKIESMPATCSLLGFNCDSCDRQISQECPEYHALRSELSQKISEASSLAEQFQFKTVKSLQQIKFLHALNVGGSKAIYVQSATKKGDNVDLSIRVGNENQAVDVLVQAKIKSADEWPMVTKKVANKVAQLF